MDSKAGQFGETAVLYAAKQKHFICSYLCGRRRLKIGKVTPQTLKPFFRQSRPFMSELAALARSFSRNLLGWLNAHCSEPVKT
jgi:hypothetical protein